MNVYDPAIHKRSHRLDRDEPKHRAQVTDRDLAFLLALFVHGPLSSAMLRAVVAPDVTQQTVSKRLDLLSHNPNYLIGMPWQLNPDEAKSSFLMFEIDPLGVEALVHAGLVTTEHARWHSGMIERRNSYEHDAMAAYVTASIQIGCGKSFVPWTKIIGAKACSAEAKAARNPLVVPYKMDGKKRELVPDALFGIKGDQGYNFFALEADRNMEPIETSEMGRTSIGKHVHGYRIALRAELYKSRWGIPNLQVAIVTTGKVHEDNILRHVERVTKKPDRSLCGSHPFLTMAVPSLSARVSDPPNTGHVYADPWRRVGEEGVLLSE